jgi:hypothetical protein
MNFQLLSKIIIDKCNEQKENKWLRNLNTNIFNDIEFNERLESINEQVSTTQSNMI